MSFIGYERKLVEFWVTRLGVGEVKQGWVPETFRHPLGSINCQLPINSVNLVVHLNYCVNITTFNFYFLYICDLAMLTTSLNDICPDTD